jgi:hypothetical protein
VLRVSVTAWYEVQAVSKRATLHESQAMLDSRRVTGGSICFGKTFCVVQEKKRGKLRQMSQPPVVRLLPFNLRKDLAKIFMGELRDWSLLSAS